MPNSKLILVLGDQLSWSNPAIAAADPQADGIILAEVREELQAEVRAEVRVEVECRRTL